MAATAEALRSDTRTRILEAAFRAVSRHGLSRVTMEDVAREAGIARQSVYRYFASKDALVTELVYREEEAFLAGVREAYAHHTELEPAIEEALRFCLNLAREHPLLDRLLETEPEVLLPYLTTRGSGMLERGVRVMEELLAGRPGIRADLVHRAADIGSRLIVSYAVTPPGESPEDVAREIAAIMASALTEGAGR